MLGGSMSIDIAGRLFATLFVATVSIGIIATPFVTAWRWSRDPYTGRESVVAMTVVGVLALFWVGVTGLRIIVGMFA